MVTFAHRFIRTPNGHIYTRGTVDYSFLSRYLVVFDEVVVLSRVEDVDETPPDKNRADGPNISIFPLPYYLGPIQFFKRYRQVNATVKRAVDTVDAYILRVAGYEGTMVWHHLMKKGIPYGVEVVADPWDVLAPGSVKTKLRPFLRRKMTWDLARQCSHASVASYVTEYGLQKRYPPGGWSTHYSTIDLSADAILDESVVDKRTERIAEKISAGKPLRLCFVGSISQLYKAPDILISSVADCIKKGLNLELIMVGGGELRAQLEKQAETLGVADRIRFIGNVPPGQAVYEQLDQADVFVLPSRQEGLPRAVIEAMARGMPCISSTVGGIAELLDCEYLVPPGDVKALAGKIEQVVTNKEKLREMSRLNLEKSHEYSIDKLSKRRKEFYQKLAEITQSWRSRTDVKK
jgi:glycosyltransferase involved in cell wall biosynthesis